MCLVTSPKLRSATVVVSLSRFRFWASGFRIQIKYNFFLHHPRLEKKGNLNVGLLSLHESLGRLVSLLPDIQDHGDLPA